MSARSRFASHPVIPHTLDQFGCVMCHRGQGAATTVEEAHSSTLAWEQPILPARYVQSSCGQCHRAALTGTPQLNLGRNLLARYGCVHCHTIKLPDGSAIKPTDDPPSLSHIADKTTREWIYAWLKDPQAYAVTATMPNFKLSDPDARDISAFLIANSTPIAGDTAPVTQRYRRRPIRPLEPACTDESFCASCHAVQNAAGNVVGGDVGPELTRIGNKVKPEWLRAWLRNPRVYDPGTAMPHYRFTDPASFPAHRLPRKQDGFRSAGQRASRCCHAGADCARQDFWSPSTAAPHATRSAASRNRITSLPELTRIGSKPLTQIIFLPGMHARYPDYISAKIRQPRSFGSALKMPQYTFAPAQIDALTTALLSLTDRAHDLPHGINRASETAFELPARRQGRTTHGGPGLLQLPRHQRPRRRHGSRPHLGRQFGAAASGCRHS